MALGVIEPCALQLPALPFPRRSDLLL